MALSYSRGQLVKLKIEGDLANVLSVVNKLSKFQTRNVMRECSKDIHDRNTQTIRAHKTPNGRPWKRKKDGSNALSDVSIDVKSSAKDFKVILNASKNGTEYGMYHQVGAKIRPRKVWKLSGKSLKQVSEKSKRLPKSTMIPNRKHFPNEWMVSIINIMKSHIAGNKNAK